MTAVAIVQLRHANPTTYFKTGSRPEFIQFQSSKTIPANIQDRFKAVGGPYSEKQIKDLEELADLVEATEPKVDMNQLALWSIAPPVFAWLLCEAMWLVFSWVRAGFKSEPRGG